MKSSKIRQVVLPLITALIWGSAFVTQSLSAAHLGCFSFNALRAIPAVLVLLVLLAVMQRIHPREKYSAEEKRALLRGGLVCGAFLALAINLQQFGMGTTSAGKAGFITALYIVLVPVFSTVLGKKAKKSIWLCVHHIPHFILAKLFLMNKRIIIIRMNLNRQRSCRINKLN